MDDVTEQIAKVKKSIERALSRLDSALDRNATLDAVNFSGTVTNLTAALDNLYEIQYSVEELEERKRGEGWRQ